MNGNLILVDVYGVESWVEKQLWGNHIHRGLPLALWRRSIFSLVNPQHILKVLLIRGDFRYPSHGLWPLWGGGGLLPVFPVTFFTTTCLKPSTIEARVPFNSGNKSYVKFGPTVSVKSHKLRHLGIGTFDHNSEISKTLFQGKLPPKPKNQLWNHFWLLKSCFRSLLHMKRKFSLFCVLHIPIWLFNTVSEKPYYGYKMCTWCRPY